MAQCLVQAREAFVGGTGLGTATSDALDTEGSVGNVGGEAAAQLVTTG